MTIARFVAVVVIVALLTPATVSALTFEPSEATTLERGTVTEPADNPTAVGIQGFTFTGATLQEKPARVIGVDRQASLSWIHGNNGGGRWFFDVDQLPNGNLLVSSPRDGETVLFEFDPDTQERVWQERFEMEDTHDVAYLGDDRMAIANMREYNETTGVSNDRIVIYNRSTDEVTWEWYFKNHYPSSTDGGYDDDWTHVNDVDPVGDDRLLLSPRNFDQVIVVDIDSKEIVDRLGSDENHDVLREQHNPDWLESQNGTSTILVADSENDRVVEYAKDDGEWVQTWEVGTESLTWPRDADRLPNGNTLITDTINHRVIEVTPTGEIVWEYYATWGPYDAERLGTAPESSGPTIRDMNASGSYSITGSAGLTAGGLAEDGVDGWIRTTAADTPVEEPMTEFATRWAHVTPWLRPVWMGDWDLLRIFGAVVVGIVWAGGEVIVNRPFSALARRLLGGL